MATNFDIEHLKQVLQHALADSGWQLESLSINKSMKWDYETLSAHFQSQEQHDREQVERELHKVGAEQ